MGLNKVFALDSKCEYVVLSLRFLYHEQVTMILFKLWVEAYRNRLVGQWVGRWVGQFSTQD